MKGKHSPHISNIEFRKRLQKWNELILFLALRLGHD